VELLKQSAPSRVVKVISTAFRRGRINFDNLQGEQKFSGTGTYNNSKLANVLFTYELARRLEGAGVTVNWCIRGWWVALGWDAGSGLRCRSGSCGRRPAVHEDPRAGREDVGVCGNLREPGGALGKFFMNRRQARTSKASHDRALAERLSTVSAYLVGLPDPSRPGSQHRVISDGRRLGLPEE
jgi:retinol dehydrogenase-14